MTEPEPEEPIDDIPDDVEEDYVIIEPDEFADSKIEDQVIFLVDVADETTVPDDGETTDLPDDYVKP